MKKMYKKNYKTNKEYITTDDMARLMSNMIYNKIDGIFRKVCVPRLSGTDIIKNSSKIFNNKRQINYEKVADIMNFLVIEACVDTLKTAKTFTEEDIKKAFGRL
ncbi:MAG: hypothetical protein ACI4U4_04455 [Bacilli bacterium]